LLAHVLEAALRGGYPMMLSPRWVVADVLLVATFEFGEPITVFIHVKTDDLFRGARRLGLHGPHDSIVRPFGGEYVNFW
jgi:hypothetical protein